MLFRELIEKHEIIVAPAAYDVVSAQIIENAGFPMAYIGGLVNEASDLGAPDLSLTTSTEIVTSLNYADSGGRELITSGNACRIFNTICSSGSLSKISEKTPLSLPIKYCLL